jgi:type IV pilus assembly protein PilW
MRSPNTSHRQSGIGIVETIVGILIGMLVLLVIYNVLSLAEGYKRTTVGVADTQTTGLFAQFVLNREISNAGNGISIGIPDFATCTNNGASGAGVGDWRLKPIPVLITDSGNNNVSDSFVVFYSNTFQVSNPVLFLTAAVTPPANKFNVQSPTGFAAGDWIIATDRVTNCWLTQVSAAPAPNAANSGQGGVDVPFANLPPAPATSFPGTGKVINLGQDGGQIDRVQYSVDAAKRQLNSQVVNPASWVAAQPVLPVAQNVVLVKAQYGIDPLDNNIVTFWTSAVPAAANAANTIGVDFSCATGGDDTQFALCNYGVNATAQRIRMVKSVRVAVVVRSEEYDKDPALVGQPSQYLFNCSANTDAGCQGRIKIDSGVGGVLGDGYRHRIYEVTIPLRNQIWNK